MDTYAEKPKDLRRWWALAILTLPVILMSVDLTVLSMAVPLLSEDLNPTSNQLLWIIDIYGVFLAGLLILMGSVGDRIGRRKLLLIGAGAFGLASCLAAFAWSAEVLVVARALLGIGGATLMPSTLSLIRNIFSDPSERRRAISIWAAAFAGGAGLGPVVGGILLEQFWWGSVFLINIPVMVLLLVAGPILLPDSKDPKPGPFAPGSALMLIVGVLAAIYGLKEAGKDGWSFVPIAWMIAGIVILALFVLRQRQMTSPLVDVSLFKHLPFTVAVLANVAGIFALVGILYFFPQYVQLVLGKSPLVAGLWAVPIAVGAIVGAIIAPPIAKRVAVGWIVGVGLAATAIGYVVFTQLGVDEHMLLAFGGGALVGFGVGLADTLTNDVIIATAPPERAGAAAGISESAYEFGGSLGTAILGTVGMSVYRGDLQTGLPPQAPLELAEAAGGTLGAAHVVATELPGEMVDQFLELAHKSFVDGMTHSFSIAAVAVAVAALGAWVALRKHRLTVSED